MQVRLWNRFANPAPSSRTQLLRQFDDMFNQLLGTAAGSDASMEFTPAYDIQETEDRYLLSVDLPGVDRNDINIEIEGNLLTVSGERKAASDREGMSFKRHGRFEQVFTIPDGVNAEAVEANYKDGVLSLSVRKPAAARATKIKIGDGSGKEAPSKGSFIKNLVGDKKGSKDSVEVRQDSPSMAN